MKCPTCESCEYEQYCGATEIMRKCERHNKKVEMTNEEWFCQLSTEEKAKFLFEHGVIACNFCKKDCVEIDYKTSECKYNVSPSYSYTGIVLWLKQPHNKRSDKK